MDKTDVNIDDVLADTAQVRLFDSRGLFGCNLGKPISVEQALRLMARFRNTPRPAKTCLDESHDRFYTKFSYSDQLRCTDDAVAEVRIGACFGYISPACKIQETFAMYECAKNIASGKCADEYIRQTIGRELFPKLYANKKQR